MTGPILPTQWRPTPLRSGLQTLRYELFRWRRPGGGPRPHHAERELAERAEDITTRVVDLLRASGFSADAVVHFGKAHIAIVEEARDWSADLVVISGNYNGATQGRVSDEHTPWVVNHAPCTVKVIS
jgi:nucleotide-binding universal stress UspA family protein